MLYTIDAAEDRVLYVSETLLRERSDVAELQMRSVLYQGCWEEGAVSGMPRDAGLMGL